MEKLSFNEITEPDDVRKFFSVTDGMENYLVPHDGSQAVLLSETAAKMLEEFGGGVGVVGSRAFHMSTASNVQSIGGQKHELYAADVEGGIIGAFQLVDICVYADGKSILLADGASASGAYVKFYEDDVILAFTDYRKGEGCELTMFAADGSSTVIVDNVTRYIRVDSSLLFYISDRDHYYRHFVLESSLRLGYNQFNTRLRGGIRRCIM